MDGRRAVLHQRYGLSTERLEAAAKHSRTLLASPPDLLAVEAALEEELGIDGRALVGAMLGGSAVRAVSCSVGTLRQRCRALLEVRAVCGLPASLPVLCKRGHRS